jgi:hypothetical protein
MSLLLLLVRVGSGLRTIVNWVVVGVPATPLMHRICRATLFNMSVRLFQAPQHHYTHLFRMASACLNLVVSLPMMSLLPSLIYRTSHLPLIHFRLASCGVLLTFSLHSWYIYSICRLTVANLLLASR